MSSLRKPSKLLSEKQSDKLAQIIQNFFIKAAHVIVHTRSELEAVDHDAGPRGSVSGDVALRVSAATKQNKWFNLDLDDYELPRDELVLWKAKDILALPSLVVETYLDLRGLNASQTLLLDDSAVKTSRKAEVVLERWLVEFDISEFDNNSLELPSVYKKIIVLFRSLYVLAGLLPAHRLRDRLVGPKMKSIGAMNVSCRILDGSKPITSKGRIGLSKRLAGDTTENDTAESHLKSRRLEPVLTPIGALRVSVSYRRNCNFRLSDNEEVLSPQFLLAAREGEREFEQREQDQQDQQDQDPDPDPDQYHPFPDRRSSTRSIQLFKVGSLNSSSSPPPGGANMAPSVSSFSTSKPIPVTLNRTSSSASLVAMLRQNRESLPKSIGSVTLAGASEMAPHGVSAGSRKFSSSFGSRFKNTSSRNNSLDGQLVTTPAAAAAAAAATNNPVLQSFKSRNKSPSPSGLVFSSGSPGPSSSIYMDDDLDSFVKMLDSKPDLRFSSNSPSLYDDSLTNFKNLQKSSDFFHLDYQQQLFKKNFSIDRSRRGSVSSVYSPSSHALKPAQAAANVTPSLTYGKFHPVSTSPSNSSLAKILRRNSSPSSTSAGTATVHTNMRKLTGSSQRTNTNSSNGSHKAVNPELLKLRSFNQEVFESDDEDHAHGVAPLSAGVRYRAGGTGTAEDDEDDLLFAMSDMTLAKNNQEF